MCVIIDTNMMELYIKSKPPKDEEKLKFYDAMKLLRQYIENKKIKLISPPKGSTLSGEYKKMNKTNDFLTEYRLQGFIETIFSENIEKAEQELVFKKKKYDIKIKSNDFHILVLAEASNTKLLATHDDDLEDDFKNPSIIGGSVYKYKTQTKLLDRNKCP